MIIGISGFIGSGKGTIGGYLVAAHGWKTMSFASSVKDVVANVFCWDRELLEGDTVESRTWRDLKDYWWSNKLGKEVTPRWALQNIGTDVMRQHFSDNIWILNLEKQILNTSGNIVITDIRFKNEMRLVRSLPMSKSVWVRRGELPPWYQDAINHNTGVESNVMSSKWPDIHHSEWGWLGQPIDYILDNDGPLISLYTKVEQMLVDINR